MNAANRFVCDAQQLGTLKMVPCLPYVSRHILFSPSMLAAHALKASKKAEKASETAASREKREAEAREKKERKTMILNKQQTQDNPQDGDGDVPPQAVGD